MTDSELVSSTVFDVSHLGGVPQEQKMIKGHLSRVTYHQVYVYTKKMQYP